MAFLMNWTTLMVAVVYAITVETLAEHHSGCCYFEQYEGKMFITKADFDQVKNSASLTHTEATIHLDRSRQMVAMDAVSTTEPGDVTRNYTFIQDNKKHQGWYIQGKTCYKVPLPASPAGLPSPCIPDGSTLLGQYKAGESELVQTWTLPNTNTSALQRLTIAVEGCVPLQTTIVQFGKLSSMTTTLFGNLTKGIADPSVFDIPSFCHG